MSNEEKSMQKQEKIIKNLEAHLRLQDEMISSLEEKNTVLEEGARELSNLMDAIISAIVLEYGTDVPLGKRLRVQHVNVVKIQEKWALHLSMEGEKMELTVIEKSRVQEMEEEMG